MESHSRSMVISMRRRISGASGFGLREKSRMVSPGTEGHYSTAGTQIGLNQSQKLFVAIFAGFSVKLAVILWCSDGFVCGCAGWGLAGIRLCRLGF
jgi:hypothetical protein